MSKKLRMNDLRKIIIEETKKVLLEAEKEKKEKEEKGEDSLDSQIDSYFSDYESEGKNSKNEGLDFRSFVRRFLREAEEEPKEEESETDQEEKAKLTSDDIDIDSFVDNVVRLVDNYDSLLEVRNTILRRAVNFLLKGYEIDVADSFKESLLERHGLEVGQSKYDHESEEFQAPAADRAGASPGS